MMNPRVAIIEPVGGHGGMDYYDFGLSGGLANAHVDVVLHTCDETLVPSDARFEVRQTFRRIYGRDASWLRGIRFARDLSIALVSTVLERRSVVHFHYFHVGILQFLPVVITRLLGRKVVITAHDVESFVNALEIRTLSRITYRLAHLVVAHNQVSKRELIDKQGIGEQKIVIVPHGNYLHLIRPLPTMDVAREQLGISKNAKVILFFGQIKEVKGLDLLIKALPSILAIHPQVLLLIAGKPWKSDFSTFDNLIDSLNVREHCLTHIRFIEDEEIPLFYGACDVVVLPYRRIYQSGVVLMAMSYSKPVLVSNLSGMTEIVENGKNGFVFQCGNSVDLAQRLLEILGDESLRLSVAQNGREHVERNYSWDLIGQSMRLHYENLVS